MTIQYSHTLGITERPESDVILPVTVTVHVVIFDSTIIHAVRYIDKDAHGASVKQIIVLIRDKIQGRHIHSPERVKEEISRIERHQHTILIHPLDDSLEFPEPHKLIATKKKVPVIK